MEKEVLFRQIADENKGRIFRICRYFFQDREDCNDACQEALIRIWQNLSTFRNQSQLSTWIYRVTVNTCLTFIRKDKSRKTLFELSGIRSAENRPDEPIIEENPQEEYKLHFFRRFMEELSPVDRTAVSLYLEELSTREIADVTGLSESNVRVKIHRLKEKIKIKWKEEQNGTGRIQNE
ncbi:MAG: RNA polymerase sigma factor [Bacteroidales bacterium]|nr:RNA polymerase sigma factor [Bacteroidales bacterium]HPI86356.1 RNA polymerase sigma factor [Bacteroidales bacterium]HPM93783.1 RNA polymerase sigma factor [Bacteroidales bacterium]